MDTPTDAPEASWGAKINTDRTRHGGNRRKLLDDCPTWADKRQQEKWSELGLIIWDHDKQALIRLHPVHALAVLEELRTTTVWQDIGFTIGEPMIAYTPAVPTSAPPTGKRASRTTTMTASIDAPVSLPHMGSTVLTNPLPLSTVQSQHLLAFLHTHEVELRAMADAAQQRYIKTISSIQDMLLDTIPEQENDAGRFGSAALLVEQASASKN